MTREDLLERAKARLNIRVPGLKKSIGAGDVVRAVTNALGIEHCSDCDRRKESLNRLLRFEAMLEKRDAERTESFVGD